MNPTADPHSLFTALLVAVILWRFYMRLRRNVGRQRLTSVRPWVVVSVYPLLLAMLALAVSMRPLALAALVGGVIAGIALGIYGFKVTRFEVTPQGLYYTPSAHIGIALSLLLAGRIAYRLIVLGPVVISQGGVVDGGVPVLPPLTLLTIGPLLGYYATYSIGLLRWRASVSAGGAHAAAPAASPGDLPSGATALPPAVAPDPTPSAGP